MSKHGLLSNMKIPISCFWWIKFAELFAFSQARCWCLQSWCKVVSHSVVIILIWHIFVFHTEKPAILWTIRYADIKKKKKSSWIQRSPLLNSVQLFLANLHKFSLQKSNTWLETYTSTSQDLFAWSFLAQSHSPGHTKVITSGKDQGFLKLVWWNRI